MEPFDRLHPALQHHVVNSLGWRTLRPLQTAAIDPILDGEHIIAVAPTAGGKTEAAVLPLLSRMVSEDWRGLSVLYVCPLRALLNDLHVRLSTYCGFVGRRAALWHGDVGQAERRRWLGDPPDVLLTTPESLESMLVSRSVDHGRWFAGVRAVVVDEAHAFAGDDRGWHLLAVLSRVSRLAGREIQRVALSATVGNPGELLTWLTVGCTSNSGTISRTAAREWPERPLTVRSSEEGDRVDVTLDFVGSLANPAVVVSRLHRGEKRLVFVDSRARAEQMALALREHDATTFVSHGSLGADERRAAEQAFREERDCVIVATSTLELGVDVGDLDRVIQIDAPPTAASFLQRLGRTGRRADTTRNALLLATTDDALLRCASVLLRWGEGYVEPIVPPPAPLHLVAQQVLALALQESGVGRMLWPEWLGGAPSSFVFGDDALAAAPGIVEHLVTTGFLVDDGGILGVGTEAEATFGRRHFMELLSVFTSPPTFSVRHGRTEIGVVPDETLLARPAGVVLAGRTWAITSVDWPRRIAQVEPTDAPGVARWSGSGQPLGATLARGVRDVLTGMQPSGCTLSRRAAAKLDELRASHPWAAQDATTLVFDAARGRARWWTFAGWRANLTLAALVDAAGLRREAAAIDDLTISVDADASPDALQRALRATPAPDALPKVPDEAVDGLKFSECLPRDLAVSVLARRLADPDSVAAAMAESSAAWHQ